MDCLSTIWQEIVARPDGPMAFRVYLQPAMSTIHAIISGLEDARGHKPPYFWAMFTDPSHRAELLRDGWKSVRNVFLLAIGMDLVYQITVLKGLRPAEGLIVAVILAIVPYLVVRGPVNRLARLFGVGASAGASPGGVDAHASTKSRGSLHFSGLRAWLMPAKALFRGGFGLAQDLESCSI